MKLICAYKGRTLGFTERRISKPYKIVNSQRKPRVLVICKVCGDGFMVIPASVKRAKFCSKKCHAADQRITMAGPNNHAWIDGRSYNKRGHRGAGWEEIAKRVYRRDNYTCQDCGVRCVGKRDKDVMRVIQCHHIESYKTSKDNSMSNLVTLCLICHLNRHGRKGVVRKWAS